MDSLNEQVLVYLKERLRSDIETIRQEILGSEQVRKQKTKKKKKKKFGLVLGPEFFHFFFVLALPTELINKNKECFERSKDIGASRNGLLSELRNSLPGGACNWRLSIGQARWEILAGRRNNFFTTIDFEF